MLVIYLLFINDIKIIKLLVQFGKWLVKRINEKWIGEKLGFIKRI